jgi:predicted transcriptional regulator
MLYMVTPMTLQLIENKQHRRDKLVILMEIIDIAKKETSKTRIMFKANLSYTQLNGYVDFLLHHNLLEKIVGKQKIRYKATCKGLDFYEKQEDVISMFNDQSGFKNTKLPKISSGKESGFCVLNLSERRQTFFW